MVNSLRADQDGGKVSTDIVAPASTWASPGSDSRDASGPMSPPEVGTEDGGMTSSHTSHPRSAPRRRGPLSDIHWPVVLGLGALALLWPITGLLGYTSGAGRALGILSATFLVWIGVGGFARIPRPVLSLALTGGVYWIITMAAMLAFGTGTPGTGWMLVAAVPELLMSCGWGALAGLGALGIQKALAGRDGS